MGIIILVVLVIVYVKLGSTSKEILWFNLIISLKILITIKICLNFLYSKIYFLITNNN